MAKRAWTVEEKTLVLVRSFGEDSGVESSRFDPRSFWTSVHFDELEEVEKLCIINGLKQKLADKVAVKKDEKLTPAEQKEAMDELWKQLCEERLWNVKGGGGKRTGMVGLKKIVVGFAGQGMSAEVIAMALGKEVEEVEKYMPKAEEKKDFGM